MTVCDGDYMCRVAQQVQKMNIYVLICVEKRGHGIVYFFSLRKLYQLESYKYSCDTIGRTCTYSCAVRCEGDVGFLER